MPSGSTPYSAGSTNDHENQARDEQRRAGRDGEPLLRLTVVSTSGVIVMTQEIAGELVADEQEAARHHQRVGRERVIEESRLRVRQ